ncbi:MAG: PQQ-binding-like beta-propeller repeat protein [Mariprofundaceae bacterium]|nr:PQQ-binding-like beta-propeller repeat protein [Mariprofundaceae bacterium]
MSKYSSRMMRVAVCILASAGLSSCSWWAGDKLATIDTELVSKSIEIVWSVDVDGRKPADPLAYGQVALTGQGEAARLVIGGRDGRAHVYDLSGGELYRIALSEGSDSGAATLASGLVVLSDTDAQLYAIDAKLGKIAWKYPLSSPVTGMPIIVDQDVLVQCTDNHIYRIDAHGEKVWSFSSQTGGLGLYLNASPLLHDGRIYALLTTGDAVALDAKTGDLVWRKQLLLNTDAPDLADLKAPQAIPVWMPELTWGSGDAKDLVLFSFYQGEVFALSAVDGSTLSSHDMSLKSAPLVDGKFLYIAGSDGSFQAIERSTGVVFWDKKLSDAELVGPVLWHDSFWLADADGTVFRVDKAGHVQASVEISGSIDRAPVVIPDGVLVHTSLGGLYLLH